MADKVKFVASYTATVQANPRDVWAVWSDPAKWSSLDEGNLVAKGKNGGFAPGSVVQLQLRSGQTVDVVLKTVVEGKEFSDETVLPYGTVYTIHKMEQSGKNLILTYTIDASVDADSADAFSREYWPNLLEGVPHQVHNVTAMAKAA